MSLHGRSPLLRLQSDERLIGYVRKGNSAAFEVLVARYHARLLAFCRHLLGSREDAEDVLQEVLAAAFNAILADDRPINVRPWLYRIARNRSLNHLRRVQAVGVDSMDVHLSDNGASTADKVHEREEFRILVGDIQDLPETQRTALVLREMDALSYEQIAEAMETTVSSVKSLLVRARVSLAEASEARLLSCDEVRIELGEVAEGLRRRPSSLVRRHLRSCKRCTIFRGQLRETNKALTALLPIGPLVLLRKLVFVHLSHSAGAGAGSSATGAGAAAQTAAVGSTAAAGASAAVGGAGGFVSAGIGAIATKAAAGLAAAALVTAGAVEVSQHPARSSRLAAATPHQSAPTAPSPAPAPAPAPASTPTFRSTVQPVHVKAKQATTDKLAATKPASPAQDPSKAADKTQNKPAKTPAKPAVLAAPPPAGTTQTQTDPTVLPPSPASATVTPVTTTPPTTTEAPTAVATTTVATPPLTTPTPTTPPTTTPPTTTPPTTTPPTTTPPTTTPPTTTPPTTTPPTTTPQTTTPPTTTPQTTTPPPPGGSSDPAGSSPGDVATNPSTGRVAQTTIAPAHTPRHHRWRHAISW
jgi:RNA polymerase sigma factor (sigma-70 family)